VPFYRVEREGGQEWQAAAVIGAFMAAVTRSEGGGNYGRLKMGELLGGQPLGLHGTGEGGGGVHGVAAREEEAALSQRGKGGRKAGWAAWAERLNRPVGGWADWAKI
jgi:hypothetical protein